MMLVTMLTPGDLFAFSRFFMETRQVHLMGPMGPGLGHLQDSPLAKKEKEERKKNKKKRRR